MLSINGFFTKPPPTPKDAAIIPAQNPIAEYLIKYDFLLSNSGLSQPISMVLRSPRLTALYKRKVLMHTAVAPTIHVPSNNNQYNTPQGTTKPRASVHTVDRIKQSKKLNKRGLFIY